MAAGDFSAANLFSTLAKLESIFGNGVPDVHNFNRPTEVARAILENQTAVANPVLEGDKCIGVKVYYYKSADTVTYVGDGTTPALALDCDLSGCVGSEADGKVLADNLRIIACSTFHDDTCATDDDFQSRSAYAMAKGMADIRAKLNNELVKRLVAAKMNNKDTGVANIDLGNGAWVDNAGDIQIPSADARIADALGELEAVAMVNMLDNYFQINGRFNWYNANYFLPYNTANGSTVVPSQQAALNDFNGHPMYWDVFDVDAVTATTSSFIIDPDAYIFWNRTISNSTTPVQLDGNRWQFYVQDPILRVRKGGSTVPLTYEVLYAKTCKGRDNNTMLTYDHSYEIKLLGGFDVAATDGILQVTSDKV